MVAGGDSEVRPLAVIGDVGVDSTLVNSIVAQVVQELGSTLRAVLVGAEGVDNPDLTSANSCGEGGRLLVTRDELDVLDTTTVGDGDCGDNLSVGKVPETESVCVVNAESRLENGDGDHIVGGQDDVLVEVNAQTVRAELLRENRELPEV